MAKALRDWTGRRVGQLTQAERSDASRKPRNKYGAKQVVAGGVRYASKAEYRRHQELMLLEHAGKISELRYQVPFELVPSVRYIDAKKSTPAMVYVADFVYIDDKGRQVIEDVKGMLTPAFKLKRHLMLALHGLHIHIHRAR